MFRLRTRVPGRHRKIKLGDWRQPWLRVAGALLLVVSACIHLDLYLTGYRSIPTIGWLFLVQAVVAFILAIGALVTHSRLVAVAGAAFALSTLGCYLLAVWIGLFGFKEIRTRAGIAAGLIEVAAFATLALAVAITGTRPAAGPTRPRPRVLAGMRAAASLVVGVVGAVSVAALVLFGIALASAGEAPASTVSAGAGVTLKTTTIRGITVLTNAKGLTLYWFAPDSPTASRCTGSCAAYWPPVTGTPKAGPGVTGKLDTIRRPGGGLLLGVLAVATPAQAASRMQIGEIWYNSPGSDRGGNSSLNHEWVQLHNTSGSWITMTGWTLRDPKHHVYTFGTYKIKPHGYVKIHTGKGANTQTDRYWGKSWYVWNNTGDTATLRDAGGHLLDKCTFKGTSRGYVFC